MRVEAHDSHFPSNAKDEDWLLEIGNRGWLVLTKDRKFHNRILEITAIARSNARVFKLTQLTCKAQKWRPYLSKRSERLHVWQLATVAIHSNC